RGDALVLTGGRPRGTLYAVYTFLEDVVGIRWWTAGERFIPQKPTLEVPDLSSVYVPKLQYREAFYRGAFDGVFAARLKTNGHFERIPPEYGGHYNLIGWCHTFYQLLPPEKYFAEHPDWYSLLNGKRTAEGGQLCLTNAEMRAELTRVALEWCRKDPTAGMISIAQNDWGGNCQCEACKAVEEAEGSPSGLIIQFVNQVAEEIEQEFPDFLIETLAYHYTRHAPKTMKPRGNVIVRLCSIECDFSRPLGTAESNKTFREDIEAWSAISPQLYIWDYVTNFANYIQPHPNWRALAPNIRLFVEHNCIGLFEQGDASCSISELPELRAWLLAHLMWDPGLDEQALTREFMAGYYGAAAEPLLQYIELMSDTVQQQNAYLRCFMTDTSSWLGLEPLNRATELFNEAQAAVADDETLATRVRRARMPLDHVWLMRYQSLKRQAKGQGLPFLGPEDPIAAAQTFVASAQEFDAGNFSEGRAFADYSPGLVARFRDPGPPPDECEGLPEEDWIDIQDNEFTLHGLGSWVTLADDEQASDKQAARMGGGHPNWATQYPVSADMAGLGSCHCYVRIRCDAKAQTGPAFTVGLYDSTGNKGVAQIIETLENAADGEYRTYDLGVHELKPGMYFWVCPPNNGDAVEAVYTDRIFCVRER
ncbi:MAG: DUF4838 domain-containing protein, partial [Armatimonadetes bacterium]|nr:DUF4838 domain-containing protein [Armatimonadota bacterium]